MQKYFTKWGHNLYPLDGEQHPNEVGYYLASDVDARIAEMRKAFEVSSTDEETRLRGRVAELEQQLEIRKAAIEAQFGLMEQVKTLTRSNERLRQKIDRLTGKR